MAQIECSIPAEPLEERSEKANHWNEVIKSLQRKAVTGVIVTPTLYFRDSRDARDVTRLAPVHVGSFLNLRVEVVSLLQDPSDAGSLWLQVLTTQLNMHFRHRTGAL